MASEQPTTAAPAAGATRSPARPVAPSRAVPAPTRPAGRRGPAPADAPRPPQAAQASPAIRPASAQDEREFLVDIEKAAAEGRIQVTDDTFSLSSQRRGAAFPILINGFFLLLLVAGIGAFGLMFGAEERSLVQETAAFATTEGRLIEELKRESQEQLEAKEREIGEIEDRLSRLDQERRDLEASITLRIQDRERDLRSALEQELAVERERLRGQGISEADIEARMRTVEVQKSQEYGARLAAFRAEAEEERRRAQESLRVMQGEYSRSLEGLTREREQLAQDARRREEDLRAQLEARTRSLQTEMSGIEQQLARMAEERQKEDLVASQINALYGAVRDHMAAARYDQALQGLAGIRTYLAQDGIAQLPAVTRRREVEAFVVTSLTRLVETERGRGTTDTSSLVAQAFSISDLRETAAAADAADAAGNLAEAERLYRRALTLVPEAEKSYAWLASRQQRADAEREARVAALLAQGEAAYGQGQNERALGFYRQALDLLPANPAQRDALAARLQAIGYSLGAERAAALQQQADAGAALREQLTGRLAEIEALQQQVAARDARIQELQASLQELRDRAAPADDGSLAAERDQALAERDRLASTIDALNAELAALRAAGAPREPGGGTAERGEMERLLAIEESFKDLQETYRQYSAEEDRILASQGGAGMLETKLRLDAFLTSDAMDELFPGLWSRIKRYDRAFQQVGRDVAVQDLADVVYGLSRIDTAQERIRRLDAQIAASATDAPMAALLKEIRQLID